jgi:hypothetical protein
MLKSSAHKSKQIVTTGEFISMVKDQNWKKDISYLLVEEFEKDKWREVNLVPVTEIYGLEWDSENGVLHFNTDDYTIDINGIRESRLMQELGDADSVEYRYTVYMS